MSQPERASRSATARPMPRLPPTISAIEGLPSDRNKLLGRSIVRLNETYYPFYYQPGRVGIFGSRRKHCGLQGKIASQEVCLAMPKQHMENGKALAKAPSGIAGLDEVTSGGLPRGRPTLVCGGPGCGKSLLGVEFLV